MGFYVKYIERKENDKVGLSKDATMTRKARPWHIFRRMNYVEESIAKERLSTCRQCSRFIKASQQCVECGCFMHIKTKLKGAECPLGYW
jgi:hypothetical protein